MRALYDTVYPAACALFLSLINHVWCVYPAACALFLTQCTSLHALFLSLVDHVWCVYPAACALFLTQRGPGNPAGAREARPGKDVAL